MYRCDLNNLKLYLTSLQIPERSTIIIHSSLFRFGVIDGGVKKIYEVIRSVFGESYTLLMPTYTWKFSETRRWDYFRSKSETGVLTEYMRNLPLARRSIHPFHSVCVLGPQADYLTADICDSSFGKNSVYEKLYKLNAFNLSLGSEFVGGATFCHFSEELMQVPYRFYKSFPGIVTDSADSRIECDFKMFVRIIEKEYFFENTWDRFWNDALSNKLAIYEKIDGVAPVFLMNIRQTTDFLSDQIAKNPYYLAKKCLK